MGIVIKFKFENDYQIRVKCSSVWVYSSPLYSCIIPQNVNFAELV